MKPTTVYSLYFSLFLSARLLTCPFSLTSTDTILTEIFFKGQKQIVQEIPGISIAILSEKKIPTLCKLIYYQIMIYDTQPQCMHVYSVVIFEEIY
jgi:hypothetical protein